MNKMTLVNMTPISKLLLMNVELMYPDCKLFNQIQTWKFRAEMQL